MILIFLRSLVNRGPYDDNLSNTGLIDTPGLANPLPHRTLWLFGELDALTIGSTHFHFNSYRVYGKSSLSRNQHLSLKVGHRAYEALEVYGLWGYKGDGTYLSFAIITGIHEH